MASIDETSRKTLHNWNRNNDSGKAETPIQLEVVEQVAYYVYDRKIRLSERASRPDHRWQQRKRHRKDIFLQLTSISNDEQDMERQRINK